MEAGVWGIEHILAFTALLCGAFFGVHRTITVIRGYGKETARQVGENRSMIKELQIDVEHRFELMAKDNKTFEPFLQKLDRLYEKVDNMQKEQQDMRVQMAKEHGHLTNEITALKKTGCEPSKEK